MSGRVSLEVLNAGSREQFLAACGRLFEGSPWVAERAWPKHPFRSLDSLHQELISAVHHAGPEEKLSLIRSHPDLVGRLTARDAALGEHSAREQAAAGLDALTEAEVRTFRRYNEDYHAKFGFPFVICARENRKEAILAEFPRRLGHGRSTEIETALAEIAKIAWLRLRDGVSEEPG